MNKRLIKLMAIFLSFVMIMASCGGSDDSSSSDSSSEASSSEASSSETSSSAEEEAPAEEAPAEEEASEPAADPVAEGLARAQAVVDSFSEPPDQITV
ncbi:MAG: hypothetical protein CL448_06940, partial [Acidimicrobiaceae bacterium]|nr:hypothetical protein [Acidimicrobiaceae bacterium]